MKARNPALVPALVLVSAFCVVTAVLGWGSYGHQQINNAAIKLMDPGNPLARCFLKNMSLVTRYAITPDYEWKLVGKAPDDPKLKSKKASNDRYEHPLHFFEPDAFIKDGKVTPEAIDRLPDGEYAKVFPEYQKMRTENESHVVDMDPAKKLKDPKLASIEEVTGHGTAPWRIKQLYNLGVQALKKGDTKMAMYYLGTMGHYVGDMSQPFHGSLNYDGKKYSPPADGIHSVFETRILAEAAASVHGKTDAGNNWTTFKATEDAVVARGKAVNLALSDSLVTRDNVVRESLRLVGSGNAYVEPLLKSFSESREKNKHLKEDHSAEDPDHSHHKAGEAAHPSTPVAVVRDFMKAQVRDPLTGKPTAVLDLANDRMGDGAALLARIWESAYRQARQENPDMPDISDCEKLAFDLGFTINNYPKPDYLPGSGAPPPPRPRPHATPGEKPPTH